VDVKTRVRPTSETVVGDVEVQDQRHRDHLVRKVDHQLDIPTTSTPVFSNVLCLGVMCGAEKVSQLLNRLVMSLFGTRMSGTSIEMVSHRIGRRVKQRGDKKIKIFTTAKTSNFIFSFLL
jgi:hypothetical protein